MHSLVDEIMSELKRGSSLRCGSSSGGYRLVTMETALLHRKKHFQLPDAELPDLVTSLINWLANHPKGEKGVDFKVDFYGRQWVEVHGGWMPGHVAKIGLPSNIIDRIWEAVHRSAVKDGLLVPKADVEAHANMMQNAGRK